MAVDSDRITPILIAPKRKQNCYDHRLRDAVFHLGQATTARYLDIPRSTIHGLKKARTKPVVTLVAPNSYVEELERRVHVLDHASRFVRLPRLFQWIGISSARYYDWKNTQECGLNDASSCPKSTPGQMTSKELFDMRLILKSVDYRHLSIGSIVRLSRNRTA